MTPDCWVLEIKITATVLCKVAGETLSLLTKELVAPIQKVCVNIRSYEN